MPRELSAQQFEAPVHLRFSSETEERHRGPHSQRPSFKTADPAFLMPFAVAFIVCSRWRGPLVNFGLLGKDDGSNMPLRPLLVAKRSISRKNPEQLGFAKVLGLKSCAQVRTVNGRFSCSLERGLHRFTYCSRPSPSTALTASAP